MASRIARFSPTRRFTGTMLHLLCLNGYPSLPVALVTPDLSGSVTAKYLSFSVRRTVPTCHPVSRTVSTCHPVSRPVTTCHRVTPAAGHGAVRPGGLPVQPGEHDCVPAGGPAAGGGAPLPAADGRIPAGGLRPCPPGRRHQGESCHILSIPPSLLLMSCHRKNQELRTICKC